jgi:glycosyltransferase involved in cell wall biosynthesis
MKILFVTDTIDCWKHGIWFHRQQTPSDALGRRGHAIKQVAMGTTFPENLLDWPDTVIFGRTYPVQYDPIKWMNEYKKRGKRVLYDMDDDFWQVAKDNPSVLTSSAMKDQYEGMIRVADAIITPSKVLAKKFKKYFKKDIYLCPNGTCNEVYVPRPKEHEGQLIIGYMGAASHWNDLSIIGEAISKLAEKYDFLFTIYGLVGEPLEAAMYAYNRIVRDKLMPEKDEYYKSALKFHDSLKSVRLFHVPFMPPELHPSVLSRVDFDIGLAPLVDTEFNRGKSCIKFYEYATVGTVTVASDVLPYSDEVGYLAKNTVKDWYNKIEKLITDTSFREKLLAKQQKWVSENRSLEAIGVEWEKACQRPGGAPILNQ